ncbi:hypothetical protein WR25_26821 [Diploscapter pachys]|uniref:Calcineurin-like phosphoesterase domain-containing protein n=1 Tax=Diploscapter pachys TaxID=2018661 RepID=A0A2A2KKI1_9BILA|nr:hypothetical protein WR25_26821 [Diploscapter pachys]
MIYGERIENILEIDSPACKKFKAQLANQRCVLEINGKGNHNDRGGSKTTSECVGDFALFVCDNLHIEDNFICNGLVSVFKDEFIYVLGQILVTPNEICGLLVDESEVNTPGFTPHRHSPRYVLHAWVGSRLFDLAVLSSSRYTGFYVGNCDAPYWLFTNMLDNIVANNGKETFRRFPGVPVVFSVGNHEAVPIDNIAPHFTPKKYHMDWLYASMADSWKGWVPDDQNSTIHYNGCYMTKLYPGLRVISLNNVYGDRINL